MKNFKWLKSKKLVIAVLGNILIMFLDIPDSQKAEALGWVDGIYIAAQGIADAYTNGKTSAST